MRMIKAQKGIAVMLMSILIGISIIAVTVTVAYSHKTKKESNVTSHAQLNSQMLAWSGVSTFRQYLLQKGADDFDDVKALPSTIELKDDQGKRVRAKNIHIIGCATATDDCKVEADVSAENETAQSALTISTVFDVSLSNKNKAAKPAGGASFGGGLTLDGTLGAEEPHSKITLNVDGNLTVGLSAKFKNIDELNINTCNGNVNIDCNAIGGADTFCKIPKINITSCGSITVTDLGKIGRFGNLYAKKSVHLFGPIAENVYSLEPPAAADSSLSIADLTEFLGIGGVDIANGSKVGNVYSMGTVVVHTASSTGNIYTDGRAVVKGINSKTGDIIANGDVELWLGGKADNITAGGKVDVHTGSKAQDISANGRVYVGEILAGVAEAEAMNVRSNTHVEIHTNGKVDSIKTLGYAYVGGLGAEVYGGIIAKGDRTTIQSSTVYTIAGAKLGGNVYAKGNIRFIQTIFDVCSIIKGNVYASGSIRDGGLIDFSCSGRFHPNNNNDVNTKIASLVTLPALPLDAATMKTNIEKKIEDDTKDIKSYVSVKPYKNEANYIFDKSSGTKRVYLNKLTNSANHESYRYDVEQNKQHVTRSGSETLLAGTGAPYFLGKYKLDGTVYIGAICETADSSGYCTSKIIGYLPRIGLVERPTVDGGLFTGIATEITNLFAGSSNADYEYLSAGRYVISSVSKRSFIDNAVLAPGIMYFDADLLIRGRGVSASTGSDYSAFVNSFLAEGDIDVSLFSPNIYSPYNVTREASAAEVCDRSLKNMNNALVDLPVTDPETISDKYLRATNLCKSGSQFAQNMNLNADKTIMTVKIDGVDVPKLDLGFVGLMSEKSIHLQFCTQIYGDVLAKGAIHSSTELICGGGQRQTVTGSMTSQTGSTGNTGLLGALTNTNKIMLGSSFIVAKEGYSNFNNGQQNPTGGTTPVLAASAITVKWFKIK